MPTLNPNIWQLQSKGDIDALMDALRHSEANIRKGAAAALRALGAWQAVPALEAALSVESDWQSHAAITAAIQYLDHDLHVENLIKAKDYRGLIKMLTSVRHDDIITACGALGQIGDRRAVESLVTVFRNPMLPSTVRLAAAEALLVLESAPAVVTLLGALRRDNWQVRRNAAAVLGQLQATWAVQPLIKTLEDSNQAVRRTASAALRRIGTAEAVAAATRYDDAQAKLATITQEMPSQGVQGTGQLPTLPTVSSDAPTLPRRPTTASLQAMPELKPEAVKSDEAPAASAISLSQITQSEAPASSVSPDPVPAETAQSSESTVESTAVPVAASTDASSDAPVAEVSASAATPPDTLPEVIPMMFRPTDTKKPTGLLNQLRVKHDVPSTPPEPEAYTGSHSESRIEPHITPPNDPAIEIIVPPSDVPTELAAMTPQQEADALRNKLAAEEAGAVGEDDAETKPVVPFEDEPPPPTTKPLG